MSRSPTLLIVNADDLGRTPGINRGIFTAHREGIVTSATLMVGFEAAAEAAAALADLPDLGVGLHLTLSGAAPTLPVDRVPHLVDRDGLLPRRPERAQGPLATQRVPPRNGPDRAGTEAPPAEQDDGQVPGGESPARDRHRSGEAEGERPGPNRSPVAGSAEPGLKTGLETGVRPIPGTGPVLDRRQQEEAWREVRAALAEVLAEVRHQLELFRRLTGRLPTHLDTHHHSHRILPLVLEAVVGIAREHGLPVRNASPEVGQRLHREGIPTTDRFVEAFYEERTATGDLLDLLGEGRGASTELMCHPARVDEELTAASTYTTERERELATLTDPAVRREVEQAGWRLGHFGHLVRPAPTDRKPPAGPEGARSW